MGYGILATGSTPACNWSSSPICVATDGSEPTHVVFDTSFGGISPSVCITSTDATVYDGFQLDVRAININANGFDVSVTGRREGSVVNVNYIAIGSALRS